MLSLNLVFNALDEAVIQIHLRNIKVVHNADRKCELHVMVWIGKLRVLILAAVLLLYVLALPSNAPPAESKPLSTLDGRQPVSPPPVRMRMVRLIGKHKGYTVDVRYPQFSGGVRGVIGKLNKDIKLVVDRNIAAVPAPSGQERYEDSCYITKSLVTPRMVSLNFEFSNYYGGAHDGKTELPLNFQIFPQLKLLNLSDVLGRKVNYNKLIRLAQEKLGAEIDLKPKHFSNFTVAEDGLTVRLPQGEFSAQACECPALTITYKDLRQHRLISKDSLMQELAIRIKHNSAKKNRIRGRRKRK